MGKECYMIYNILDHSEVVFRGGYSEVKAEINSFFKKNGTEKYKLFKETSLRHKFYNNGKENVFYERWQET